MHVHLTALALTLALAGCSGGKDTGPTDDTGTVPKLDPALELGTGDIEFVPIADGDTVFVVFGPQGGYHINSSLRVQGIDNGEPTDVDDPDNPVTSFAATLDGVSLNLSGDATDYKQGIDPVPGEPGVYEMIGRRLLLNITDDAQLDGKTIEMTVHVEDKDGVALDDTRTVVCVPDPFND